VTLLTALVAMAVIIVGYQSISEQRRAAAEARQSLADHAKALEAEEKGRQLDRLRAAPALVARARKAFNERDSYAATEALGEALKIDSKLAEAHLLMGQILAYQQDYQGAVAALNAYVALKPEDEDAREILQLCQEGAEKGRTAGLVSELAQVFGRQGLTQQAARLAMSVSETRDRYRAEIRRGWPRLRDVDLRYAGDGTFELFLPHHFREVTDLSPLRGMALSRLEFRDNDDLRDLKALRGMPLKWLDLTSCHGVQDLGPLEGAGLEALHLHETQVDDLSALEGMPLKALELSRTQVSSIAALKGAPLQRLEIAFTRVKDITPLAGAPLRHLELGHTGISDLTPLAEAPLVFLEIARTQVSDLSPLKGKSLRVLVLDGTPVSDLSPLEGMPLRNLGLEACPKIEDFSAIEGMPLQELRLANTKFSDLSLLQGMPLDSLDLWDCKNIADITLLKGTQISRLSIGKTKVRDLSPLKGMPLEVLSIVESAVTDLSPLEGLDLRELHFTPARITKGIEAARNMKSLQGIRLNRYGDYTPVHEFWAREDLHVALKAKNPKYTRRGWCRTDRGKVADVRMEHCEVTDLSPVQGMPLRSLVCGHNPLTDLSPIKGMPLETLFIWATKVTDLSPVKGMRLKRFSASGTPITDLAPLAGMTTLETLSIDGSRVTDLTPLKGLKIEHMAFTPKMITQGIEAVREMGTLKSIGPYWDNRLEPDEFWQKYDAGEFGLPKKGAGTAE